MRRAQFPSPRQASCAGLRRQFYSAATRELIDYDYDNALPQEARVWLAAFTEEYYRGWRLKRETQLSVDLAREGGRASAWSRRHGHAELHCKTDPLEEATEDVPRGESPDPVERIEAEQQRRRTAALALMVRRAG